MSVTDSSKIEQASASGVIAWLKLVIEQPAADISLKLRGNILHVLCETIASLDQNSTLLRIVRGLLDRETQLAIPRAYPQVYQIYFYNRVQGEQKPTWTAPIYLNRLERHLAQLVLEAQDDDDLQATQELLERYADGHDHQSDDYDEEGSRGAIVLSNLSLARKGDPNAIAWYLSETLSSLDVGVWVSIKAIPGTARLHRQAIMAEDVVQQPGETQIPRLWILCQATYSPDPALIAKPTAKRLRQLKLTNFKDAVLLLQVQGESRPDWSLRVDLTPVEEMLREWGRWGDGYAIAKLLSQNLAPLRLSIQAEIKAETLHLICHPLGQSLEVFPEWATVEEFISPLLETLGPQGLHQAVVFGQPTENSSEPAWVGYLDLPGKEHEALGMPPETLASQGDLPAIAYLLTRQLNPDLEEHLETGGLRVQLLIKDRLLHVMVDGPVAPQRRSVSQAVVERLEVLNPSGVQGVRVYGRRSGQAEPAWSYGHNFETRQRLVPEATPEFAASDAYVNELLAHPEAAVTATDAEAVAESEDSWGRRLGQAARRWLLRSHLFKSGQDAPDLLPGSEESIPGGLKVAAVWGTVGLLVALQLDWVLGQISRPPQTPGAAEAISPPQPTTEDTSLLNALQELDWGQSDSSAATDPAATDSAEADFINTEDPQELPTSPEQPLVAIEPLLNQSPYPSFRSQQLDEKLALYYQRLEQSGPPDVIIVGSSRALRGVDPTALRQELTGLGYPDATIFNFGVNGATAQVVDLIIRRILLPSQLPKLIIWADGARAFNSGRVDVTYNAITTSEGYRELVNGRLDVGATAADLAAAPEEEATNASLASSYEEMDRWFSDQLASLSASHPDRERLKTWLQQQLVTIAKPLQIGQESIEEELDAPMPEGSQIDFDGFLALPIQFNPATYYQDYARVSGRYDGDYKDFHLNGRQDEAFQDLLDYTQAQDIPMVFVNTPLTDEYLDGYRTAAEEDFLQYMLQFSTSEAGFIFRDLGQVWQDQYDYFSDPSHLNRYGAYQVSNRIAQDPMIPWSRVTESRRP